MFYEFMSLAKLNFSIVEIEGEENAILLDNEHGQVFHIKLFSGEEIPLGHLPGRENNEEYGYYSQESLAIFFTGHAIFLMEIQRSALRL